MRNGTEGPDLGMVGGLWAQYQNALALNGGQIKMEAISGGIGGIGGGVSVGSIGGGASSPGRVDQSMSSPNLLENPDETSSSGQKDDDDGSEDDSDDRLDQNTPHDPERLKAFNVS